MTKLLILTICLGFVLINLSTALVNPCKRGAGKQQFFAHPDTDEKFIQCTQWGQMFIFSCPDNLRWSQEKGSCDRVLKSPVITKPPVQQTVVPQTAVPTVQQVQVQITQTVPTITVPMPVTFRPELGVTATILPPIRTTVGVQTQPPTVTVAPVVVATSTQFPSVIEESDQCNIVQISDSTVSLVNGIYGKLVQVDSIFRREDDTTIPGLIVKLPVSQVWCVTYKFPLAQLKTLTAELVEKRCHTDSNGMLSKLDCCILTSQVDGQSVALPTRQWTINRGSPKIGQIDLAVKVQCLSDVSGSVLPEPLNVQPVQPVLPVQPTQPILPALPIQTVQPVLPVEQVTVRPVIQQTVKPTTVVTIPTVVQTTTVPTTVLPKLPAILPTLPVETKKTPLLSVPATLSPQAQLDEMVRIQKLLQAQQIQQQLLQQQAINKGTLNQNVVANQGLTTPIRLTTTTTAAPVQTTTRRPKPPQPSLTITEEERFQQLVAQAMGLVVDSSKSPINSIVANTCDFVKCPSTFICAARNGCTNCNPACFPSVDKMTVENAFFINCENVICPSNSRCALDVKDNLFKCIQ